MKLLLVNPNTSKDMTARIASVAEAAAAPGTQIDACTAARGFPYISSRAEAQIAGAIALEMIADRIDDVDAVVIAAFGDPGLRAARELFDAPVIGLAEASILTAAMLGDRFGIVTFTPQMTAWYGESVTASGLAARFTGFRTPATTRGAVADAATTMRDDLAALVDLSAREDGADAVILGGAPLAGLAATLAEASSAVLIDPVVVAVTQAEALARIAPRGASRGGYARPPRKRTQGLGAGLTRWMAPGVGDDA